MERREFVDRLKTLPLVGACVAALSSKPSEAALRDGKQNKATRQGPRLPVTCGVSRCQNHPNHTDVLGLYPVAVDCYAPLIVHDGSMVCTHRTDCQPVPVSWANERYEKAHRELCAEARDDGVRPPNYEEFIASFWCGECLHGGDPTTGEQKYEQEDDEDE